MKCIAKKVARYEFHVNGKGILGYHCPTCGQYICTVKTGDHYCKNCGQKLDWGRRK